MTKLSKLANVSINLLSEEEASHSFSFEQFSITPHDNTQTAFLMSVLWLYKEEHQSVILDTVEAVENIEVPNLRPVKQSKYIKLVDTMRSAKIDLFLMTL